MFKKDSAVIIGLVIACCFIMSIIDAVVQPGYMLKSIVKIFLFLICPVIYSRYNKKTNLEGKWLG